MITKVELCGEAESAAPPGAGRFVRLWGLDTSDLPPSATPHKELAPFLTAVLHEALPFIDDVPTDATSTDSAWRPDGVKKFSNSVALVNLYKRVVPVKHLKLAMRGHDSANCVKPRRLRAETWSLRRSVHEDAEIPGTAGWKEWYRCFKEDHALAEKEFTPSVLSYRRMKSWKCKDLKIVQGDHTWTNITLRWEESVHKLPFPLQKRVFPVLQITASDENHVDAAEFVVIQIPVRDIDAPGRNRAVLGAYTSVERLRRTANGVEWIMGTVSDAGGILPLALQKLAIPGQIAKDVDMFLTWIVEERKKPAVGTELSSEHAQRWQGYYETGTQQNTAQAHESVQESVQGQTQDTTQNTVQEQAPTQTQEKGKKPVEGTGLGSERAQQNQVQLDSLDSSSQQDTVQARESAREQIQEQTQSTIPNTVQEQAQAQTQDQRKKPVEGTGLESSLQQDTVQAREPAQEQIQGQTQRTIQDNIKEQAPTQTQEQTQGPSIQPSDQRGSLPSDKAGRQKDRQE
ncbi:hypothetical protein E4U60_001728 [Claviceps pazoutovae]|uniref:DUF3074 domain-containing protein n=1 Tax=Claviceps pazoutovae TaxID=1649127 RepID=A0A9P7MBY5_9HYPO|nr:hypothetical protein E4U60_001728 [Claviceps pazoutovae]